MAQVKINDAKILSDKHYTFKLLDYDLQKQNGNWEKRKEEIIERGNAVAALLYNKEAGTIILTQQFRIATYINGNKSGMLAEACAGLINGNESPEEAIIREIKEETGYAVTDVQKVYQAYSSAGVLTELLYLYVASYSANQKVSPGSGLEQEKEEINIIELPFAEAIKILEKGGIQDAKTIILLQYAQLKGLM